MAADSSERPTSRKSAASMPAAPTLSIFERYRDMIAGHLAKPMMSFYLVMGLTAALVVFGLVMMLSASAVDSLKTFGSAYSLFTKQLVFAVAGVLAMVVAMRISLARWRALSALMFGGILVLLVLVLIPGIGQSVYGARRWFYIAGLSLQPSELAKVAFLLWGAHVLVQRRRYLSSWQGMLKPIVPGLALLCGLVVVEPDLHTTVTYVIIFLGLMWILGAPGRLFLAILGVGVVLLVGAIASQGFRMARLVAFLDPWADPQGAGHQAIQGFYALATGGFFGVGLGNSRTKWGALPNAHSDYIFAIIGEELGFVGCALVLLLFVGLAYTGLRIVRRSQDLFIQLVAGATVVWMMGQAVINILYVIGWMPVTGITLPLISSGGTSIVVTMFTMGILGSCARHETAAVKHLQSRTRRFGKWLSLPVPTSARVDAERLPTSREKSTKLAADRKSTGKRAAGKPARAQATTVRQRGSGSTRQADRTGRTVGQRRDGDPRKTGEVRSRSDARRAGDRRRANDARRSGEPRRTSEGQRRTSPSRRPHRDYEGNSRGRRAG